MKKYMMIVLTLTLSVFLLTGCTAKSSVPETQKNTTTAADTDQEEETPAPIAVSTLEKINAEKAKEMMDAGDKLIILDVRTQEEYQEGHIEGAILIPDFEIESKAEEILTDKNTTVLVYCRSGRRSALASQKLSDLGYTSIYDFGGIIDWPYEVVTD